MPSPGRHTVVRWGWVWAAAPALVVGLGLLALAVTRTGAWDVVAGDLGHLVFGWGALPEVVGGAGGLAWLVGALAAHPGGTLAEGASAPSLDGAALPLAVGTLVWIAGWGLVASGIRRRPGVEPAPSEAAGAVLHPRLFRYRDFYWTTLAAYGGGILFAEATVIGLQMVLAGGASNDTTRTFSPVVAFSIALLAGFAVAFAGGALGAWRAKRLATPELTIAIIYFGLPLPVLLTLMHRVPQLSLSLAYRLREVAYVAGLLGRPEIGYWLVFAGLVLLLFFGITSGFVATSSGRVDLKAGFELFVAARHAQVFRPGLLFGAFVVLIFGIVPPLLVYAILLSTEAAVERTRVRALGLADPLASAEALNELKARDQTPTAMMTALAVGGVGVGVMALIIVLSVMSGFELDLQSKMLGVNAHAIVLKYSGSMTDYPEVVAKAKEVKGVSGATPFILNEVMITSDGNISGTMIKGIDAKSVGTVTDLPKYMTSGSLEALDEPALIEQRPADRGLFPEPTGVKGPGGAAPEAPDDIIVAPKTEAKAAPMPGVVIGRELAASLRVMVGDRVNIVAPLGGDLGPQGPMPKSRPFRVAGIFYSGMYEFDSKFTYIRLQEAQRFFNVEGATGVELKFVDPDDARRLSKAVYDKLEGYPYRTKDWGEMNRNLFSALRLEKLVMAIILSIIVIVASGLIVATVIMLVLEKRKEISVLKALGVPDGGIVKIFLAEGLQIGVAGGLLGLLAGLAWCLFVERVGIKLDPEVYYIPALPVKIEPIQTAISVVSAVLVSFLASIYPALKASRVEPVDGLKAE